MEDREGRKEGEQQTNYSSVALRPLQHFNSELKGGLGGVWGVWGRRRGRTETRTARTEKRRVLIEHETSPRGFPSISTPRSLSSHCP